jgi:hypothetical protein
MASNKNKEAYSELSKSITKSIPKTVRQKEGIYFTPNVIVNDLITMVTPYILNHYTKILEPSCGSCEIVRILCEKFTDLEIDCVEYNKTIYDNIKDLDFISVKDGINDNNKNTVHIYNQDFLTFNKSCATLYDLIIGNPPYFVISKDKVPKEYSEYICGRPNIFCLFILHSLSMLSLDGILAFVVPKSFFNSIYYAEIRNYIKATCKIIKITDYSTYNEFLDTDQPTFGILLQKTSLEPIEEVLLEETDNYSVLLNGNYIFTDNATKIKEMLSGATTLKALGLTVKTGTVVWNEKKELLRDDNEFTTLLYNTNVTNDNKIKLTTFKNGEKFQYIEQEGTTDPVIVVNRGNGNATYNFKYALVANMAPYLVENHLNIINPPANLNNNEKIKLLNKVIESFKNEKTKEFIKLFFGNNGLSKTELETILPIYL